MHSLYKPQQEQDSLYTFPYHHISSYAPFSQVLNDPWGINYVATLEFLIDTIKKVGVVERYLDIGCGDGRLVMELARQFPDSHITGIDYSQRAITLAKAMYPEGDFVCQDITNSQLDKSFNAAFLIEVFEHIVPNHIEDFIKAIATMLESRSYLFITVPHKNKAVEPHHFQHFTSRSLTDYFSKYFDIEAIIPFEKISIKKRFIDFILSNHFFILNNKWLKDRIYTYYKQHLFYVHREEWCQRLFVLMKKKK